MGPVGVGCGYHTDCGGDARFVGGDVDDCEAAATEAEQEGGVPGVNEYCATCIGGMWSGSPGATSRLRCLPLCTSVVGDLVLC